MPRTARMVIPGVPYHITQRGNRRQDVFFCDDHRRRYLAWLHHYAQCYNLQVVAYCLMGNHVHLIVIPHSPASIARTLQAVNTLHSQSINIEFGWSGHLWHGRYYSAPLDDPHLWAAVRYIELNPVRIGLVACAWDYQWSSAGCHIGLKHEPLLSAKTLWTIPHDEWREALTVPPEEELLNDIRSCTRTGLPCGSKEFVVRIGKATGRDFTTRPVGRPKKDKDQGP